MERMDNEMSETLITLTSDIVAAHLSNNNVTVDEVPALIQNVYGALHGLGNVTQEEEKPEPAVSIRASVKSDHLVCLEDGKKMKMLKRHLRSAYGMSPEDYRRKWDLPSDYPMVAPNYAAQRAAFAKSMGLGHGGRGRKKRK